MVDDLSTCHRPVGDLLDAVAGRDWREFRLTDDQVAFFHEYGYLSGIRLLDDQQVEVLCDELAALVDPQHPGSELFYEYNWLCRKHSLTRRNRQTVQSEATRFSSSTTCFRPVRT